MEKLNIFLAAPLFNERERDFNSKVAKILRDNGFNVWLAQEAPFISKGTDEEKRAIFNGDIKALKESDVVVAVLDGIEIESGVAFEIGYAHCLGKPIIGLKTDYRTFSKIEEINLILEVPMIKICHKIEKVLSTLKRINAGK